MTLLAQRVVTASVVLVYTHSTYGSVTAVSRASGCHLCAFEKPVYEDDSFHTKHVGRVSLGGTGELRSGKKGKRKLNLLPRASRSSVLPGRHASRPRCVSFVFIPINRERERAAQGHLGIQCQSQDLNLPSRGS